MIESRVRKRTACRSSHTIDDALQWADPDKIVMGLNLPSDNVKRVLDSLRNRQNPLELHAKWRDDENTNEKHTKILGLDLAKRMKVEPDKRV